MTDLSMNVNIAKAQAMLSIVEGNTTVERGILLEDSQFCTLLTQCAHKDSVAFGALLLTDYVNENF